MKSLKEMIKKVITFCITRTLKTDEGVEEKRQIPVYQLIKVNNGSKVKRQMHTVLNNIILGASYNRHQVGYGSLNEDEYLSIVYDQSTDHPVLSFNRTEDCVDVTKAYEAFRDRININRTSAYRAAEFVLRDMFEDYELIHDIVSELWAFSMYERSTLHLDRAYYNTLRLLDDDYQDQLCRFEANNYSCVRELMHDHTLLLDAIDNENDTLQEHTEWLNYTELPCK